MHRRKDVNQKEIDLDPQQIKSQINELKMELEQVRAPGEAKRLRQQLHKLQINQLLALDKMEWYVEMDEMGLFDKCWAMRFSEYLLSSQGIRHVQTVIYVVSNGAELLMQYAGNYIYLVNYVIIWKYYLKVFYIYERTPFELLNPKNTVMRR